MHFILLQTHPKKVLKETITTKTDKSVRGKNSSVGTDKS